jgi:hypothetical protein
MQYPNSGALFMRDKKGEKSPDWGGDINMEVSLLKTLIEESDGDSVKIKISGWVRQGNRGEFISVKYDSFKPMNQDRQFNEPRQAPKPKPVETFDDDGSDVPF